MSINPGEHAIVFGMTGSGKSTLTEKISTLFSRRVIFDRLHEWRGRVEGAVTVRNFEQFKAAYKHFYEQDFFTIIFEPQAGLPQEILLEMVNHTLHLIYMVEDHAKKGILVVFEEVWLYAPLHNIPVWFQETMLTGRHKRISVIGNSQRPASVSKVLVSQARHVFIGQFYEARDKKYFEDTFGRIPEIARPPAKYNFYWFRPQEKTLLITTG